MTLSAAQTYRARKARTRLNLAITYLESARYEAQEAGMRRLVVTLDRLAREAAGVLGQLADQQPAKTGGAS